MLGSHPPTGWHTAEGRAFAPVPFAEDFVNSDPPSIRCAFELVARVFSAFLHPICKNGNINDYVVCAPPHYVERRCGYSRIAVRQVLHLRVFRCGRPRRR